MKNIILIGIMGCGKTTIAKLLAQKLNRPIIDIDEYIVDKEKLTIPEMFEISETYFRAKETEACKEMAKLQGYIVSTGGGVVLNSLNMNYLKQNGMIVFVDRPVDRIIDDVEISTRPLLKEGAQKLYVLNKQRYQLYLDACDIHLINDDTLENVTNNLISILARSVF